MNLSHLRYFVELAHTRHYTRAAEHLFITQPSLSHAIGQLESELGVPLFERSGRNTTLTRLGEEFLVCAERTLSTLDSGVESLRRSAQGEGLIRLGLVRPLGVDFIPDLAARFLAENPGKEIHFTFGTGVTQQLLDGLLARRYDLVFSSMPPAELGLSARPVVRQDLVLVVPPDHPLAGRKSIDLEETLSYPYVSFSRGSGMRDTVDAQRKSGSQYVRSRITNDVPEKSNGESAFLYFTREIGQEALYLLDEPENSLSAQLQLELKQFLEDSVRFYGCQLVIATHSPFLLSLKDAEIYDLDRVPVSRCRWTELENVRTFYKFFQAHQREFS